MTQLSVSGREKLEGMLKLEEGIRCSMYIDSVGCESIGIGHNLRNKPISIEAVEIILKNDIDDCIAELTNNLPVYSELDENRRIALIDLCFQLGYHGLTTFKETLSALEQRKWENASNALLNSFYAKEIPERAQKMANILLTGLL